MKNKMLMVLASCEKHPTLNRPTGLWLGASTRRDVSRQGCHHSWHQLVAGVEAARNRYRDFFGLGCDCFAF